MGIHTTEPHLHSDGYVGVGVSRAARICAAAHGGQIVLSQATAGIVEDDDLLDVRLRDLGDHLLKDISLPQRLFQIEADGLPPEFPPLGTGTAAGTIATLVAIDLAGWRRVDEPADGAIACGWRNTPRIVVEAARANDGVELEGAADWSLCLLLAQECALRSRRDPGGTSRQRLDPDRETRTPRGVHTGRVTRSWRANSDRSVHLQAMRVGRARAGTCLTLRAPRANSSESLDCAISEERELAGITPMHVYELVGPPVPRDHRLPAKALRRRLLKGHFRTLAQTNVRDHGAMSTIQIVTERLHLRRFRLRTSRRSSPAGATPKSRDISRGIARIRWPMPSLS